jgi:nitroreductase
MGIETTINKRRNIKPELFSGAAIPDADVQALLDAANWAPTHGHTEPWRFHVFSKERMQAFLDAYREVLVQIESEQERINTLMQVWELRAKLSSHIIVVAMKRGDNPKIPVWEEIAAVGAAVQNMWLLATERNIAMYWGSGGLTTQPLFKEAFGYGEQDLMMGFLILGRYEGEWPEGKRKSDISAKTDW